MLTTNPGENIILKCFENKLFYSFESNLLISPQTPIYVKFLNDVGIRSRTQIIPTRGEIIKLMYVTDRELITSNKSNWVEIFNPISHQKLAVIKYNCDISCLFTIRDMLIIGAHRGKMIVQTKYLEYDQVCFYCLEMFRFEGIDVRKRCIHHVFSEMPLYPPN
jgi:hypothetical protein